MARSAYAYICTDSVFNYLPTAIDAPPGKAYGTREGSVSMIAELDRLARTYSTADGHGFGYFIIGDGSTKQIQEMLLCSKLDVETVFGSDAFFSGGIDLKGKLEAFRKLYNPAGELILTPAEDKLSIAKDMGVVPVRLEGAGYPVNGYNFESVDMEGVPGLVVAKFGLLESADNVHRPKYA